MKERYDIAVDYHEVTWVSANMKEESAKAFCDGSSFFESIPAPSIEAHQCLRMWEALRYGRAFGEQ